MRLPCRVTLVALVLLLAALVSLPLWPPVGPVWQGEASLEPCLSHEVHDPAAAAGEPLEDAWRAAEATDPGPAAEDAASGPDESAAEAEAPPDERGEPVPSYILYAVQAGDTLWDLAQANGLAVASLQYSNSMDSRTSLAIGQKLRLPTQPGLLHTVRTGDTLARLAERFKVNVDAIAAANGLASADPLPVGAVLLVPGGRAPQPAATASRGTARYIWPVRGRLTSPYGPRWGRFHHGIDVAVPTGTNIVAAGAGTVSYAGWRGGYGNTVIIAHGGGFQTLYAHASALLVKAGQPVTQGQAIARIGSTGQSTGPHLHFEVRVNGATRNPRAYLP